VVGRRGAERLRCFWVGEGASLAFGTVGVGAGSFLICLGAAAGAGGFTDVPSMRIAAPHFLHFIRARRPAILSSGTLNFAEQ